MSQILIVGGSNGIGLSIALYMAGTAEKIYIVDRVSPAQDLPRNIQFVAFNLLNNDFSVFDQFTRVDTLILTAGVGRVAPFESLLEQEIVNNFKVNTLGAIRIIKHFYSRLCSNENFYCAVMGSIAGLIASPLFSVYGASKAALCKFIESVNIELEMSSSPNRILNVSPGSIKGTSFNGGESDPEQTQELARQIVFQMQNRQTLFIPEYQEVFRDVLARYHDDAHQFGLQSYRHKKENNRINASPQLKVGYLSGTFDLFHVGHLNLLRRAKEYCDYLVVGVHKDGSHKNKETFIPFEERVDIVRNIKHVDDVIESMPEDVDVYKSGVVQYDYLFVGSDYKGTERFQKYELYFSDKNVRIIYFPYTQGTSSSKLRETLICRK